MSIEPLQGLRGETGEAFSVTRAIKSAARQSGLDFGLMMGVAKRESSLNADAKAATSSASGLFQFLDQTWLGAVKEHGATLGLGSVAKDIQYADKKFTVTDPARREEILNLRFKPAIAAKVAGQTLAAAKDRLSAALGREASGSEVYMAHFLGERGALRMLNAGDTATAADIDPRAARANKPLFFDGSRPVSVAEFKEKIALKLDNSPAVGRRNDPAIRHSGAPQAFPGPRAGSARPRWTAAPVAFEPTENRASIAPNLGQPAQPKAERPGTERADLSSLRAVLPTELYAKIVEMQSDFILGGDRD